MIAMCDVSCHLRHSLSHRPCQAKVNIGDGSASRSSTWLAYGLKPKPAHHYESESDDNDNDRNHQKVWESIRRLQKMLEGTENHQKLWKTSEAAENVGRCGKMLEALEHVAGDRKDF